ncbi:MAG: hypothetical protein ACXABY_08835, partial [Candidatus Thorarchaeota archaeon]
AWEKTRAAIKTPMGQIAMYGALAVGAYSTIRGIFADDEVGIPPVRPPMSGPPMPPPPMTSRPMDRGPQDLPLMRPPARISPGHPAPIPSRGVARAYSGVRRPGASLEHANGVGMRIRDETDPMSRHMIARRMSEVASRDFTR